MDLKRRRRVLRRLRRRQAGVRLRLWWRRTRGSGRIEKIAAFTKISDESLCSLCDYPAIRAFINERLPFEVLKAEEEQLLAGAGDVERVELPGLSRRLLTVADLLVKTEPSGTTIRYLRETDDG